MLELIPEPPELIPELIPWATSFSWLPSTAKINTDTIFVHRMIRFLVLLS